jgi:hypothetical protein
MWVDFNERDGRGHVLAYPMSAADQRLLEPSTIFVVTDDEDMAFACVVGVAGKGRDRVVRLELAPGDIDAYVEPAMRAISDRCEP